MKKSTRSAKERVSDLPAILKAMRQGVREALIQHKLAGNPVAVWRDGKAVWLQPEDIPFGPEVRRVKPKRSAKRKPRASKNHGSG